MSNRAKLGLVLFLYLLAGAASADHNLSLGTPLNDSTCLVGPSIDFSFYMDQTADNCHLFTNTSGTWGLDYYIGAGTVGYNVFNFSFSPGSYLWNIECYDTPPADYTWLINNLTMTVTDAPYCAVLSGTECPLNPSVGSEAVFTTRLSNTLGSYLQGQDCNVWIEDSGGRTIKTFRSMSYSQETVTITDEEGNDINVINDPDFVTTDALGYYVFPFDVSSDWAWVGDEFSVYATCNGQQATCKFNVTKTRLPDSENITQLGKDASGFILLLIVLIAVILISWKYGLRLGRRVL